VRLAVRISPFGGCWPADVRAYQGGRRLLRAVHLVGSVVVPADAGFLAAVS
jgi:hypothetical protein